MNEENKEKIKEEEKMRAEAKAEAEEETKKKKKAEENEKLVFGSLIIILFILFWVLINFWIGLLIAALGGMMLQKIKENNPKVKNAIPSLLGISIVLLLLAIFLPAIQSDKEFRGERDEIIEGTSEEFDYATEKGEPERDIELKAMKAIGHKTNMDEKKVREVDIKENLIYIEFMGDENITTGMTKGGMLSDIKDLLRELPATFDFEVEKMTFEVWLPLVDEYGNEEISDVITMTVSRDNWENINWDNFFAEDLPDIAEDYWIHPALQE